MADIVIRPSLKWIFAAYIAILLLVVLSLILGLNGVYGSAPLWVALVPALFIVWPLKRHVHSRFTRMTISGDTLRYETGVLSRSKHLIQISKVQNVRVNQSPAQRMFDTGNISVETAGETSLLEMRNIDRPDSVAGQILRVARGSAGSDPSQPKTEQA
jgi:membrane protein YdbS with pleckstrin-like domain